MRYGSSVADRRLANLRALVATVQQGLHHREYHIGVVGYYIGAGAPISTSRQRPRGQHVQARSFPPYTCLRSHSLVRRQTAETPRRMLP